MQRVGPYEVVRELGRGAMGVVFEVRHPTIAERLALKMILQPESTGLERFRREADVLSYLGRHANIVGFREAGLEGGHPYIVMDFIEGETLDGALKRGELSTDHAVRVLIGVARALHFAHEAQVIHRDVKPANILIDRGGRPFLSDFGVAKSLQADRLTLTGEMVGTPAYMAPEQLEGGRSIDRRADVYALGAVLYEVLTGVRPFAGDKISMVKKILLDPPPRPGAQSATPPPPDLEALCLECLAKQPSDRPPSAEVFARRLETYLGEGGNADEPVSRGLPVAAVAALLVAALFLGAVAGRALAAPVAVQPTATPAPTTAASVRAGLAFGAVRGERAAVASLLKQTDATPAEALATAEALCAAVRADPTPSEAVGTRLVEAAQVVIAAVDPASDADAVLVRRSWDCLIAARVVAPAIDARSAIAAIDRLGTAKAGAVRAASSPWRALWAEKGALVETAVVERTLAADVTPADSKAVRLASRPTFPAAFGQFLHHISRSTNWWWGRYVQADVRLAVFAELALRRPRLHFLEYELGMALMQVGRVREANALLERAVRGDAAGESWYRVARVRRLYDAAGADPISRKGIELDLTSKRKTRWSRHTLAEILVQRGRPEDLVEAEEILRNNKPNLRHWRNTNLLRQVLKRLGKPDEPGLAIAEANQRKAEIRNMFQNKHGWTEALREAIYPKGAR